MLRSFFIYLSKAAWARKIVTGWKFAWKAASRFIAGDKLEDAIRVIKALNEKGINATLDHLGEHTSNTEEAARATQDILTAIDAIQQTGVRANVSIKLTQIGFALGEEICAGNLHRILEYAREKGTFVRIDMEDSPCVDATLETYRRMLDCGLTNTGVVLQSYLYRTEKDLKAVLEKGGKVRLPVDQPFEAANPGLAPAVAACLQ